MNVRYTDSTTVYQGLSQTANKNGKNNIRTNKSVEIRITVVT